MLNRRPPVPRINRPSAPAVNPSPFMNTDISPQEGKYVGAASPSISAVYSQSWSQNVVLRFLFLCFFSFISSWYYWFFFSQKDFMVCYFNFLTSYSENGMLFFWLLFPQTIIITFMRIVLSRALPHKNSVRENGFLSWFHLLLPVWPWARGLTSLSPGQFHLYNWHGNRFVLSRAKPCVRNK